MTSKQTKRIASLLPNGKPKCIRCYDNGGVDAKGGSIDRYTVVFTGNYRKKTGGEFVYLGMNAAPFHPQGVGMHGSSQQQIDVVNGSWGGPAIGRSCHLGKRIAFDDLPPDCQRLVMSDYNDLWDLDEPDARLHMRERKCAGWSTQKQSTLA